MPHRSGAKAASAGAALTASRYSKPGRGAQIREVRGVFRHDEQLHHPIALSREARRGAHASHTAARKHGDAAFPARRRACAVGPDAAASNRRVYDALNVLMAMDIITKEKKNIILIGIGHMPLAL